MKLNTFLIAIVGVIGIGSIGLFAFESTIIFSRSFREAEAVYEKSLRDVGDTVLRAKVYSLESSSAQIQKNSTLAKLYLLHAGQGEGLRKERDRLLSQLGGDYLEVVSLQDQEAAFKQPLTLERERILAAAKGNASFSVSGGQLLYYFPLRFFRDVVAVGILGYSLNPTVAAEVSKIAKTDAHFVGDKLVLDSNPLGQIGISSRWTIVTVGLIWTLLLIVSVFAFLKFGFVRGFQRLVRRLEHVTDELQNGRIETLESETSPVHEINTLSRALTTLTQGMADFMLRLQTKARTEAMGEKAAQLTHDLKGPITALTLALDLDSLEQWSEQKKHTVRAVLERMRTITQDLAREGQAHSSSSCEDIPQLLRTIVDEKRIQFQTRAGLRIKQSGATHGVFADIDGEGFKRAVSNVIENASEAMPEGGTISVGLSLSGAFVNVFVDDEGGGIPEEQIPRIGERGFSFGKPGGSGLGIWHAMNVLKSARGSLSLKAREGKGTRVQLSLPCASAPIWATPSIELQKDTVVVVLDDDPSVHALWAERLQTLGVTAEYFSEVQTLIDYVISHPLERSRMLFLCDFELKQEGWSGLDLVEELGIAHQSVLVTGHYEDPSIRDRCTRNGLRLLSKGAMASVPLRMMENPQGHRTSNDARKFLLAFFLFAGGQAVAETLADSIIQTEARFSTTVAAPDRPVTVVFGIQDSSEMLPRSLLRAVTLQSLKKAQITAIVFEADYLSELRRSVVPPALLLAPKLVIELKVEPAKNTSGYVSTCQMDYLEYGHGYGDNHFRARRLWTRRQETTVISKSDLEASLVRYIQKEIPSLTPLGRKSTLLANAEGSRGKIPEGTASYRLRWSDPDGRRGRFYAGVSAGTPALFNLNVGFWGTARVPLVLDVSGMFYSYDRRGIQALAGWAVDNEGPLKQGVGLAFTMLGESASSSSTVYSSLESSPSVVTTNDLSMHPYLGPSYFLDWNQIRLQVGVQTRLTGDGQAPIRVLFQIGFVPALPF